MRTTNLAIYSRKRISVAALCLSQLLLLPSPCAFAQSEIRTQDWSRADRSSAGLAPLPESEPGAVVHVYAARTVRWRKYFAVHSWIATKAKNAKTYTTYHVIGWRLRRGLSPVVIEEGIPDAKWFGHEPELLLDLRGKAAERAIPKIHEAALSYPHPNEYRAWPGPNSNTFVSHILRHTPGMGVELPPTAIGKDWIHDGDLVGYTESGTGVQFSLFGLLGMTMGLAEGIELNVLGMSFGVDILRPALKLPFVGRIGMKDSAIFDPNKEDSPPVSEEHSPPVAIAID